MSARLPKISDGAMDWGVAVAVAVILLVTGFSESAGSGGLELLGYVLLVTGGLVLGFRRRVPGVVLVVSGLCAAGYQASGVDVPAVAFLVAVYTAMRGGRRLVTVVVSVGVLAALPVSVYLSGQHDLGEVFARSRGALEIAWLVAAAMAGEALRQAERRADAAERTREEVARRRADAERLHLARELHDSLTHQISIVKVQSEVAVHVARRNGEPVSEALLAIQQAGREATRELRATLAALRDDDTAPPRGVDDVPGLVERARALGLEVELSVAGGAEDVPDTVDRTVFRIVQESLTNVARHSGAKTASVRIDREPGVLRVEVRDDGAGGAAGGVEAGVGIAGMRERVAALGGRLRAQPEREGGFTVAAELPLGGSL